MDNLYQFVVNSGKLWKNSWKKKQNETDYRKTHGKPPNLMVDPVFFLDYFGSIHQFQRHTHMWLYVVLTPPSNMNHDQSMNRPPKTMVQKGIYQDLPTFWTCLDHLGSV